MTSGEFENEKEQRGGTWFTPYWQDGSDPDEVLLNRLVDLGYMEYEYRRTR